MHQYRASNYMLGNMICRRWAVAGYIMLLIVVIILLSGVLSRYWQPDRLPRLIVDDSVASDLHTLAEETWDTFLTVFHARVDCFGDVYLHAERALGSRAVYNPDRAMVTVRVQGLLLCSKVRLSMSGLTTSNFNVRRIVPLDKPSWQHRGCLLIRHGGLTRPGQIHLPNNTPKRRSSSCSADERSRLKYGSPRKWCMSLRNGQPAMNFRSIQNGRVG
jgi:hypothetical protein